MGHVKTSLSVLVAINFMIASPSSSTPSTSIIFSVSSSQFSFNLFSEMEMIFVLTYFCFCLWSLRLGCPPPSPNPSSPSLMICPLTLDPKSNFISLLQNGVTQLLTAVKILSNSVHIWLSSTRGTLRFSNSKEQRHGEKFLKLWFSRLCSATARTLSPDSAFYVGAQANTFCRYMQVYMNRVQLWGSS